MWKCLYPLANPQIAVLLLGSLTLAPFAVGSALKVSTN